MCCVLGHVVIALSVVMAFVVGGVTTTVIVISCFKRFVFTFYRFNGIKQIMLISKSLSSMSVTVIFYFFVSNKINYISNPEKIRLKLVMFR